MGAGWNRSSSSSSSPRSSDGTGISSSSSSVLGSSNPTGSSWRNVYVPPLGRCELVEPRGDDRHPAFVAQGIVDHGAEDDVRLRVGRLGDRLGGPVRLVQPEVGPAGHREQEPAGALDRGLQERRGDAPRAASSARLSPDAAPIPISAEPALVNTVRTSAKSRLMRPGVMMRLVIPSTPWYRT